MFYMVCIGRANIRETLSKGAAIFSMSKPRLDGKVAIITGAASGIGEAAARLFAENGAFVVIVDVQDELGNQVGGSIGPEKCCYKHCNVCDEKQVQEVIDYALEKFGRLDILFSNAGLVGTPSSILDLDMAEFCKPMDVNVHGAAIVIKHGARAMVEKKIRGSIVCTASVASSIGGAGPHAYTASKHALLGLVRSVSGELGKYGIRINCISPSAVATPLACATVNRSPAEIEAHCSAVSKLKGVVLKPHHLAEVAMFLASDESAFITGQNLQVDGGFTSFNRSLRFYE